MKIPSPLCVDTDKLCSIIKEEISRQRGHISFARFMELALYEPTFGYYQTQSDKFGEKGDFVTAPLISPLFAKCIANQTAEVLTVIHRGDILEIGAGSGSLAKEVLLSLEKKQQLPTHYYILEISQTLKHQQKAYFADTIPHLLSRIFWVDDLPTQFQGIIFANEVMDAMPIHCFRVAKDGIKERCVTFLKGEFKWVEIENDFKKHLPPDLNLPFGYESEINLSLKKWIEELAKTLKQGIILLADYGYGRHEYYHPDRHQGTLMCFHQQKKHANPFIHIGKQDITAHVDFTSLAEAAFDFELEIGGFTTQSSFLLSSGILDFANQFTSHREQFNQNQAIKMLTLPSQMGEIVKFMALTKNYSEPLLGFKLFGREQNL